VNARSRINTSAGRSVVEHHMREHFGTPKAALPQDTLCWRLSPFVQVTLKPDYDRIDSFWTLQIHRVFHPTPQGTLLNGRQNFA
jgi:hypothetical protein